MLIRIKLLYLQVLLVYKRYLRNYLLYSFYFFAVALIIFPYTNLFPLVNAQDVGSTNTGSSNLATWISGLNGASSFCTNLSTYVKDKEDTKLLFCGPIVSENSDPFFTGQLGVTSLLPVKLVAGDMAIWEKDGKQSRYYSKNLGEVVASTSGQLFQNKPTDTSYYITNIANRLNPVQGVMAQDVTSNIVPDGRVILSSIANIHSSFMNIVFMIYVFIFLIIAFAIMMRQKLSGSTYVTIMNSIPRVIISLVLVAFSYPIAAVMIDLGYGSMNVLYDIAVNQITWNVKSSPTDGVGQAKKLSEVESVYYGSQKTDVKKLIQDIKPTARSMNLFKVFSTSDIAAQNTGLNASFDLDTFETQQDTFGMINGIAKLFSQLFSKGIETGTSDSVVISGLVLTVISIAALFSAFKLFFILLKEFLNILFYPLAAPFMFALYAMPGNDKLIVTWFKNYAGSIFSFVGVYAVFLLIVMMGHGLVLNTQNAWNPFLLGFVNAPTIGSLSALIGYGLFIISPQVPDMVKKAIGSAGGGADKYVKSITDETRRAAARLTLGAVG